MTTTPEAVERVRAEPGDYQRLTATHAEVRRWASLAAAAETAQGRVQTLQRGVEAVDAEIAALEQAAQVRETDRAAAEVRRRSAAASRDVRAIKDAAGDLAAFEAIDEIDAERRAELEERRRDLLEKLIPDAQSEADKASAEADAAKSDKTPRRSVDLVVLWKISRLASTALAEKILSQDAGEDAADLVEDLAGMADQVARDSYVDRDGFEQLLAVVTPSSRGPVRPRMTPEEARKALPDVVEALGREAAQRDASAWGAQQVMTSVAALADTNFVQTTGIGGR